MKYIIENWGGRRFLLVLGSCITFTLLLAFGRIDQAMYATLILPTLGGYLVANGAQKRDQSKQEATE